MNRIDALFERLRPENQRALMPFITAGDPDLPMTASLIRELVDRGAHLIEVGIPYSDPIADGPVVSASYTRALQGGVKLPKIFETIKSLRDGGVACPLVAMVSFAIIHRRGVASFLEDATTSGFDGLIVPDLPVEEAAPLLDAATAKGLRLIQLITPTTPRERAVAIAKTTTGFIYYVSVAGITGERKELPTQLTDEVAWLRTQTKLPICVGFGISDAGQVKQVAAVADGVIVGSAIVRRLANIGDQDRAEVVKNVGAFVKELAGGLG